jgi:ankyrin repeat protein
MEEEKIYKELLSEIENDGDLTTFINIYYKANNNIFENKINKKITFLFKESCIYAHFDICKWLWNLSVKINSPIDIHTDENINFAFLCGKSDPSMLQWLWKISLEINLPFKINDYNNRYFFEACANNNLNVAKWLWELSIKMNQLIDVHTRNNILFCYAAYINGNLEMLKWLWEISGEKSPLNKESMNYYFCGACEKGSFNIVKWIWDKSLEINDPIDLNYFNDNIDMTPFMCCCGNGHLEIANWLFQKSQELKTPIDIHQNENDAFFLACKGGSLDIVKLLWDLSIIGDDISALIEIFNESRDINVFASACYSGNLELVEWLWNSINKFYKDNNLYSQLNINTSFISCCGRYSYVSKTSISGKLRTMKWLWKLSNDIKFPLEIKTIGEAFELCCENNYLEIVEWLFELSQSLNNQFDINRDDDCFFRKACEGGNLKIAKYLWNLSKKIESPINIHADDEYAFRISCKIGHDHIAKWLWKLSNEIKSPINIHAKDEYAFRECCVIGDIIPLRKIHTLDFLCSLYEGYEYYHKTNQNGKKVMSYYNIIHPNKLPKIHNKNILLYDETDILKI